MFIPPTQKPQLFLLHFAGGNCYSFQFLQPYLKHFDVKTLELPGRGMRMGEPLILDFEEAALDMLGQIKPCLNGAPFLIYGHSMGAYLTLRVTQLLEELGKSPVGIVVSGNAGPGMDANKGRYLLQGDDFLTELRKLGGIPEEIIQNEEMFAFFEPVLRADFMLAATNELADGPKVSVPVYALMGDEEDRVERIENWAEFTHSTFEAEVLKGDHFFIHKHPQRISSVLKTFYVKHALMKTL